MFVVMRRVREEMHLLILVLVAMLSGCMANDRALTAEAPAAVGGQKEVEQLYTMGRVVDLVCQAGEVGVTLPARLIPNIRFIVNPGNRHMAVCVLSELSVARPVGSEVPLVIRKGKLVAVERAAPAYRGRY